MRKRWTAVVAALLCAAGSARAATYCIDISGTCDVSLSGAVGFQTALNSAAGSAGNDVIRLGVATYVGPFSYTPLAAAGTLEIVGAGVDQTVLTAAAPSTGFVNVLTLRRDLVGNPANVSRLTVVAPAPTGTGSSIGIATDAIVEDARVVASPGSLGSRQGVILSGSGSGVRRTTIEMSNAGQSNALLTLAGTTVTPDPAPAFLEDSSALNGLVTVDASFPLRMTRARVSARGNCAISARGITVTVEDSLVLADGATGLSAQPDGTPGVLRARHVTVVDVGAVPTFSAMRVDSSIGGTSRMEVTHSIFVGFQYTSFRRAAANGSATLAVGASVLRRGADQVQGDGDTTFTEPQANLDVDPLLTAEFRLQDGSPAIDAAFSPSLAEGESATDLDGQPRIQDGNGDGTAARDMGAFEHAAVPVVSTTTTLPSCTDEAAFASVRCRLDALAAATAVGVPAGTLATKLAALVARAADRVTAAETARAEGRAKPARKALGKAAKALALFVRRAEGRAASGLDPSVVGALSAAARTIRDDVRALRSQG